MKKYIDNWKTTSSGILLIATGITVYIADKTKLIEALTSVLGGIGLIFASDSQKGEPTT